MISIGDFLKNNTPRLSFDHHFFFFKRQPAVTFHGFIARQGRWFFFVSCQKRVGSSTLKRRLGNRDFRAFATFSKRVISTRDFSAGEWGTSWEMGKPQAPSATTKKMDRILPEIWDNKKSKCFFDALDIQTPGFWRYLGPRITKNHHLQTPNVSRYLDA